MLKKNPRRQYFIDRSFQASFIFKFCIVVILSSIIIAGAIFLLSQGSTTVAIENTQVVVKKTADFIAPIVSWVLIIVTILSAIVVGLICLFVSHKIAGPLYRIKKEVETLADGNLKANFNIRSSDQLQELAKSLDKMVKSIKGNRKEIVSKLDNLRTFLREKDYSIQSSDESKVVELLSEVESSIDSFKS